MKKILYLLTLVILYNCQRPYFEFDKVEHYHTRYSEKQIHAMYETSDRNLQGLLFEDFLPPIDKIFQTKIDSYYPLKSVLDASDRGKLREVFKSKTFSRLSATKCSPIYRDILIFKKNNKITGVSKICFDCKLGIILDSSGNKNELNMDDFEKLENILE